MEHNAHVLIMRIQFSLDLPDLFLLAPKLEVAFRDFKFSNSPAVNLNIKSYGIVIIQ